MANREFHKKNIKEKAAHLASMFGHRDFPQVNKGLSEPQEPGCQTSSQVTTNQCLELPFPLVHLLWHEELFTF